MDLKDKAKAELYFQPLVDLYTDLEQDMLENIAKQLKGKTHLLKTDPQAWELQMLQNLGILSKENLQLIKQKANIKSSELNAMLYGAGVDGLEKSEEALMKAIKDGAHLKVPAPIASSPVILDIIAAYRNQAKQFLNLTNQSMLQGSDLIYRDIINRTVADTLTGNLTGEQALRKTIRQWANKGIPTLTDKSGRTWGVEGYVRTVMMSATNNVVHQMQDERFTQYGVEYVEVSSKSGARPKCAPYQGRIYALQPESKDYPYIGDTSWGMPDGLFGINCGHYKYAFIPGISQKRYEPTKDEALNKKQYAESQKQREIERSIRKAKTQARMFKASGDEVGYKKATKLVGARQSRMRDFIDKTGRTRRYNREGIVSGTQDFKTVAGKAPKPPKTPPKPKSTVKTETPKAIKKSNNSGMMKAGPGNDLPPPKKPVKKPKPEYVTETKKVYKKGQYHTETKTFIKDSPEHKAYLEKNKKVEYVKIEKKSEATGKMIPQTVIKGSPEHKAYLKSLEKPKAAKMSDYPPKPPKKKTPADIEKEVNPPKNIPKKPSKPVKVKSFDPSQYRYIDPDTGDLKAEKELLKQRMDSRQAEALGQYTGSLYRQINDYLRFGKRDQSFVVSRMDEAFNTKKRIGTPLSQNTIFNRYADINAVNGMFGDEIGELVMDAFDNMNNARLFGALQEELEKKLINAKVSDKGFVSTSYAKDMDAFRKDLGVQFEMFMPKGYDDGIFVESISEFASEKEYLLNRGTEFQIKAIKIEKGKDGYTNLVVQMMPVPRKTKVYKTG